MMTEVAIAVPVEDGACWGDGRGVGGLLLGDTATIVSATTTVNNAAIAR